jgi:transketolase
MKKKPKKKIGQKSRKLKKKKMSKLRKKKRRSKIKKKIKKFKRQKKTKPKKIIRISRKIKKRKKGKIARRRILKAMIAQKMGKQIAMRIMFHNPLYHLHQQQQWICCLSAQVFHRKSVNYQCLLMT